MVELQIVILAVAGSSPVGHPETPCAVASAKQGTGRGTRAAKERSVITPTLHSRVIVNKAADFWPRIANDESLKNCGDLAKLLAGCEIIAAVDDLELLAA